jgi:predicted site-specific integrase-resolvase
MILFKHNGITKLNKMEESSYEAGGYVASKKARELLGVHVQTLYQWERKGWIETIRSPGGHRLYNVNKYLMGRQKATCDEKVCDEDNIPEGRKNIIYARVSSLGQRSDLEHQKTELKKKYPHHFLVEDVGSGMNMNRRGYRKLIDWIIEGNVNEVVVMHKDRLARYGYDLFEYLLEKYSNGKIIIVEAKKDIEPEEELVKDVLEIMNVFVARMNGMRKYNSMKKYKKI